MWTRRDGVVWGWEGVDWGWQSKGAGQEWDGGTGHALVRARVPRGDDALDPGGSWRARADATETSVETTRVNRHLSPSLPLSF